MPSTTMSLCLWSRQIYSGSVKTGKLFLRLLRQKGCTVLLLCAASSGIPLLCSASELSNNSNVVSAYRISGLVMSMWRLVAAGQHEVQLPLRLAVCKVDYCLMLSACKHSAGLFTGLCSDRQPPHALTYDSSSLLLLWCCRPDFPANGFSTPPPANRALRGLSSGTSARKVSADKQVYVSPLRSSPHKQVT